MSQSQVSYIIIYATKKKMLKITMAHEDFSKAFDKVTHDSLAHKDGNMQIGGNGSCRD